MKRKFRISLKIKKCDFIFSEELGPGVVGQVDVDYDLKPEEYGSAIFIQSLLEERDRLTDELVFTILEEIK